MTAACAARVEHVDGWQRNRFKVEQAHKTGSVDSTGNSRTGGTGRTGSADSSQMGRTGRIGRTGNKRMRRTGRMSSRRTSRKGPKVE